MMPGTPVIMTQGNGLHKLSIAFLTLITQNPL